MNEKITVRVWMAMAEMNARKIAMDYGKSEQFVGQFLKGKRTSQALVNFLIKEGCPSENFKHGRISA